MEGQYTKISLILKLKNFWNKILQFFGEEKKNLRTLPQIEINIKHLKEDKITSSSKI